jgi:peptidoglycan/xylan/chitin deacetylase (PgdA/CDA1 family)
MNRKGVHAAEFLPEIIEGLRKKGFTFVTVGDLLRGANPNIQKNPK